MGPILILILGLALAPGAAFAGDFSIRVAMREKSAATFYVPGEIEGVGVTEFMVDTGSGYMTINQDTLARLEERGGARYVKQLRGVLADGTELVVPVYRIDRVALGEDCVLYDVEAAVFPQTSRQILGLSALRQAAPFIFSVDPPELVLSGCGPVPAVGDQPPALTAALDEDLDNAASGPALAE